MSKQIFKKDFLVDELDLPFNNDLVKMDEIIGTTRWSVLHTIVFEYEGKFYQTEYSIGATEQQDEGPWEYEDEVECVEVEEKEVTVTKWVKVND